MSQWSLVQKKLGNENDFIAEIEAETITFTRLGGYNASPFSLNLNIVNFLSEKSLKGVLRWWSRAAVVGALGGKIDYVEANKFLKRIYGGVGVVDKEKSRSSKFRLVVETECPKEFEVRVKKVLREYDTFHQHCVDFLRAQRNRSSWKISLNPSGPEVLFNTQHQKINNKTVESIVRSSPLGKFIQSVWEGRRGISVLLKIPDITERCQHPRLKLLFMRRGGEESDELSAGNIPSADVEKYVSRIKQELVTLETIGFKFRIKVLGEKDPVACNFVLSALLMSLIFGGVGSLTRRGFGSLKLTKIKLCSEVDFDEDLRKVSEALTNKISDDATLEHLLERLRAMCVRHAGQYFKLSAPLGSANIPRVPSLSNFKLRVILCKANNFGKMGEVFLKNKWKKDPKQTGKNLHTWVLGLPRHVGGTGYFVSNGNRRISSIGLRLFSDGEKKFVILYGFLSEDWPDSMKSLGRGRSPETISKSLLEQTYTEAFQKIENLVRGLCMSQTA